MVRIDLTMTLASTLSADGCITSSPMELCVSSSLKWYLTWSSLFFPSLGTAVHWHCRSVAVPHLPSPVCSVDLSKQRQNGSQKMNWRKGMVEQSSSSWFEQDWLIQLCMKPVYYAIMILDVSYFLREWRSCHKSMMFWRIVVFILFVFSDVSWIFLRKK